MSEHTVHMSGNVAIIEVSDSYSRETLMQLRDIAEAAAQKGAKSIILNMQKLPQINSQGIGILVLINDVCKQAGGKLILVALSKMVERVLQLAGVRNFFTVHTDEAEAMASLPSIGIEKAAEVKAEPVVADDLPDDPQMLALEAHSAVKTYIKSQRHHDAVEFFSKRVEQSASLDDVALALGVPRLTAELVLGDLAGTDILTMDGETFHWHPTGEALRAMRVYRKALSSPKLRSRIMAWLHT